MQTAVDKREIDRHSLIRVFVGAAVCNLLSRLSTWVKYENQLYAHIERHFGDQVVRGRSRLLYLTDHSLDLCRSESLSGRTY